MPDADAYLKSAGNSSVKLLHVLYAQCNKLNEDAQIIIMDEFNALSQKGLLDISTAGFSDYRQSLASLNNSTTTRCRTPRATATTANYVNTTWRAPASVRSSMRS